MVGRSRLHLLLGLAAIFMGLVIIPGASVRASDVYPGLQPQFAQAQSNLQVDVWVSPEAAQPGDQINLNVSLSAGDGAFLSPELDIFLPGSLALDLSYLPAGTSYNIQTSNLTWRPILANSDSPWLLTFPITVSSVDLSSPEQAVKVILREGTVETEYFGNFWVGVPPNPSIMFSPPQAAVGQAINLTSESSGPGPLAQIWNLGDGRTLAINNPEVVYSTPGTYQVTLQVSNPIAIVSTTAQLTISAQPIASFSVPDTTLTSGDVVPFVDRSGGQQPLHYSWDFGDGTGSNDPNPTHQYQGEGNYQVHLTVVNELGQSDTYQTLSVGQKPVADIVIDKTPEAGRLFEVQAFHDSSISNVKWDMGDGTFYEGERINHVYWSPGDYLITASFTNEYGETNIQEWIRVGPGMLYLYIPYIVYGISEPVVPAPDQVDQASTPNNLDLPADEANRLLALELPQEMQPAEQLFAYINEARRINNLGPVQMVFELNAAAQSHTDDMAALGYTSHEGSDGSSPALRIQRSGYAGGYAGEATAWGMQSAYEPVQYWLTSPDHRVILLNPAATEVGVGFSLNFGAPSVWYWTAEFASMNLTRIQVPDPQLVVNEAGEQITPEVEVPKVIQLLGPPQNSEFILSNENFLIFTWSWPEPLLEDQRFVIYLNSQGRIYQIGVVREAENNTQYQYKVQASDVPVSPGAHQWLVRLENSKQATLIMESDYWPISFRQP